MGTISFGIHGYETVGLEDQYVLAAVMKGPAQGYMLFDRDRQVMEGSPDASTDPYKAMAPRAFLMKKGSGSGCEWWLFVPPEGEDLAVVYPALVVRGVVMAKVRVQFHSRRAAIGRLERGAPFALESPPAARRDIACHCGCQ